MKNPVPKFMGYGEADTAFVPGGRIADDRPKGADSEQAPLQTCQGLTKYRNVQTLREEVRIDFLNLGNLKLPQECFCALFGPNKVWGLDR